MHPRNASIAISQADQSAKGARAFTRRKAKRSIPATFRHTDPCQTKRTHRALTTRNDAQRAETARNDAHKPPQAPTSPHKPPQAPTTPNDAQRRPQARHSSACARARACARGCACARGRACARGCACARGRACARGCACARIGAQPGPRALHSTSRTSVTLAAGP
jgi:hypothetical protein